MEYFKGKSVLITGGSSGIGFALAKLLVLSEANITILARKEGNLTKAKSMLEFHAQSPNQKILALKADVIDRLSLTELLNNWVHKNGLPDVVINSAGVAHPGTFTSLRPEIFDWMMDVNYFGTVNVLKTLVPLMKKRRSGNIINISSVAGFIGVYGYTAYGASKFAISGLSDALRSELKPFGINVSIAFPPDTDTPQLDYEKEFKPFITKKIAGSAKLMSAEDVAYEILKKAAKKKYLILPGLESKFLYFGHNLLGQGIYPVMDWMVRSAISSIKDK